MNDETKMSIAEREAENAGPQCAFQRLRLDMDDVRDAYIAGRTAEPCDEQVESVARYLADTSDGWNTLTEADREPFRETAAEILQVARKAVM